MDPHGDFRVALRRGRKRVEMAAAHAARAAGYELRRRHYYEPFPDVERLSSSLWDGPHATPGLELDVDRAARVVHELAEYLAEFPATGFPIANGSYQWGDAETLYALLRHLKPRRVMELGSGSSTRVISLARAANATDGHPFAFESFDPFAGWHPLGQVEGLDVHPVFAEQIDPSALDTLNDGDVLFVDTTHTVKTGGDVTHIILHLLPCVAAGVYVHFHDIFLPYEYPRDLVVDKRRAWAEQYLLQAFLAFNPLFEVYLPVYALSRQRPELLRELIPHYANMRGAGPGAFWIRRIT